MQSIVSIKGKENRLEIYLDEKATYPVLREELMAKLKRNKEFFNNPDTKILLRGKELSLAQRREIKRVFSMDYGIEDVLFEEEAEQQREAQQAQRQESAVEQQQDTNRSDEYAGEVELVSNAYFDANSLFIRNTVRSGQRIECEGDVVVVGDVNHGAEIIAGGSIAVFGRLRGLAHAGCQGREDVCVCALNMCPKQLRVSGRVVTFPNKSSREEFQGPEVAELVNGKVKIRSVNVK